MMQQCRLCLSGSWSFIITIIESFYTNIRTSFPHSFIHSINRYFFLLKTV